jgi:hypothetical protein
MRRAFIALSMIFIIAALVAVSGCGKSSKTVNLDKMLMDGESWTYEGSEGNLVVFGEDGTFRSVSGSAVENGAYKVFKMDDSNRAELTFVDKEGHEVRVEEWSMTGDIGKADGGVTDLQGQEFILRGTKDTLR